MSAEFYLDSLGIYHATALDRLPWVEHGFGTRQSAGWLAGRSTATARQIHSDLSLVAGPGSAGCLGEGDALLTREPGCLIAIKTADCLPVLIADPTQRVVAAIHAGWRGTVANICGKTVGRMVREFGSRKDELIVAIGPGIGPCCFEVGPEVGIHLQSVLPERADLAQRTRIDLVEVNRRYLERTGLTREQISAANMCTCCNLHFESYRRDKDESGRMFSAVGILD